MPDLVPLPGSERSQLQGAAPAPEPLDDSQVITVTVLLRRRAEVPAALVEGPQTISTSELGDRYGADPADAQLVSEVLGSYGLTVTETHLASRRMMVSGTITAMQAALAALKPDGRAPLPPSIPFIELQQLVGFPEYWERETRYKATD